MCFSLFLYSGHDGRGHFGQNDFLLLHLRYGVKRNYLNMSYGIVVFGVDIIEFAKILERTTDGLR